jgi:antitoxin component YwqK of YwqJK toxin-antitoxin module
MLDDWQNDTCAGKYLKTIHERRIPKNGVQGTTGRVGMPRSYGGFFHTGFKGMENRPVMAMDGYGGQTFTIDFERGRIVATQAIHDNMKFPKPGSFDWKKIVYERIKNGKPASGTKKPAEPVIDPQQIILEQKAKQEAEKIAKQYWDDYYDAIDDSLVASLIAKAVNPDGKKISKYQNGKTKSEEHYKDGKKEGKFTTWYQSGEIRSETNYKNNSKEGTDTSWYVNGQKNAETIYKNGNKEGKSSAWYDDGQIKLEESYIDDKREGIRTTWYINGQKMYEDNFKNGKFDGKKTHWHDNGQIKSEGNYKDGKRI